MKNTRRTFPSKRDGRRRRTRAACFHADACFHIYVSYVTRGGMLLCHCRTIKAYIPATLYPARPPPPYLSSSSLLGMSAAEEHFHFIGRQRNEYREGRDSPPLPEPRIYRNPNWVTCGHSGHCSWMPRRIICMPVLTDSHDGCRVHPGRLCFRADALECQVGRKTRELFEEWKNSEIIK